MKARFAFTEEQVASVLGLHRDRVAELRKEHLAVRGEAELVRGAWRWTARGVKRAVELMGIGKSAAATAERLLEADGQGAVHEANEAGEVSSDGAGGDRELSGILDAVVVRVFKKNRRYLEATLGSRTVTVRVRCNERFVDGMVLPARSLARVHDGLYDFIGRCPRGRGAW